MNAVVLWITIYMQATEAQGADLKGEDILYSFTLTEQVMKGNKAIKTIEQDDFAMRIFSFHWASYPINISHFILPDRKRTERFHVQLFLSRINPFRYKSPYDIYDISLT